MRSLNSWSVPRLHPQERSTQTINGGRQRSLRASGGAPSIFLIPSQGSLSVADLRLSRSLCNIKGISCGVVGGPVRAGGTGVGAILQSGPKRKALHFHRSKQAQNWSWQWCVCLCVFACMCLFVCALNSLFNERKLYSCVKFLPINPTIQTDQS